MPVRPRYFYSWAWLGLAPDAPLSALATETSNVCKLNSAELDVLNAGKPKPTSGRFLERECFNAR